MTDILIFALLGLLSQLKIILDQNTFYGTMQVLLPKQNNMHGIYFHLFCPNNERFLHMHKMFIDHEGDIREEIAFDQICSVESKKVPARIALGKVSKKS